ncbi:Uncharacterised protein [Serratia quinivorans]|nr:Uncharacterised protein [Serratia quinivorans]
MMKIAMSLHKKVTIITLIAMGAAFSGDGGRKILPPVVGKGALNTSTHLQFDDISIGLGTYAMLHQPIYQPVDLQR